METFQIAKMTTKYKCTALSITDKITICECLDKGYSIEKTLLTCNILYVLFNK